MPDALVYPEIFPAQQHRYQYRQISPPVGDKAAGTEGERCRFTIDALVRRLRDFCDNPSRVRSWQQDLEAREALALDRFTLEALRPAYAQLLGLTADAASETGAETTKPASA